jgi:hypothetical protein
MLSIRTETKVKGTPKIPTNQAACHPIAKVFKNRENHLRLCIKTSVAFTDSPALAFKYILSSPVIKTGNNRLSVKMENTHARMLAPKKVNKLSLVRKKLSLKHAQVLRFSFFTIFPSPLVYGFSVFKVAIFPTAQLVLSGTRHAHFEVLLHGKASRIDVKTIKVINNHIGRS